MAVASHPAESSAIVDQATITSVVPVFVAIMVWVIRILIIGTLSLAMDRLLHPGAEQRTAFQNALSASARQPRQPVQTTQPMNIPAGLNSAGIPARPSASRAMAGSRGTRPAVQETEEYENTNSGYARSEPTYHSMSMSARPPVKTAGSNPNTNDNNANNRYRR
jgi:hypothetical protein